MKFTATLMANHLPTPSARYFVLSSLQQVSKLKANPFPFLCKRIPDGRGPISSPRTPLFLPHRACWKEVSGSEHSTEPGEGEGGGAAAAEQTFDITTDTTNGQQSRFASVAHTH